MPSIITHHMFGLDMLEHISRSLGDTKEESDAFLLGNQGPDILFFSPVNPKHVRSYDLGSRLHRSNPADVIWAFEEAASSLSPEARPIADAYIMGLFCHYMVDSTLHPFIYAQQNEICDAGIEGLTQADGHEVHAEIESDLDVMVLTAMTGRTISDFHPSRNLLRGNDFTLAVISAMYQQVAWSLFGEKVSKDIFVSGTKAYRALARSLFSPRGIKRTILGGLERIFRNHSIVQAMSQRNRLQDESDFDNRDRREWIYPGTGEVRNDSFWDLYTEAFDRTLSMIARVPSMGRSELDSTLGSLDFNGQPTAPFIIEVETID